MWDFVVVGAGPAGSRFAYRTATAGYDVLLLERSTVGEPLACSGHVSRDIWTYTGDIKETLLENRIRGARFHPSWTAEDGTYPFFRSEPISMVIDRIGLDQHLAARARKAGADVRTDRTVTAVEESDDAVTVTVQTPTGTETHRGRILVGCDGPQSRVRSELNIEPPEQFLHGVFGYTATQDAGDFVDVHLSVSGLFAWRIPRGDHGVEYGIAAPPGSGVTEQFGRLQEKYDVDVETTHSGVIPIGPPDTVTSHRGLLIGDAAGQTKPFTGGGILYGLACADHAARTVDPWQPRSLARYERAWRDDLGTEILLGKILKRAYALPTPVQKLGLNLFSGKIGVHMDRPTSLFSREQLRSLLD